MSLKIHKLGGYPWILEYLVHRNENRLEIKEHQQIVEGLCYFLRGEIRCAQVENFSSNFDLGRSIIRITQIYCLQKPKKLNVPQ